MRPHPAIPAFAALAALAALAIATLPVAAAPPTAHHFPIQGVARDANGWRIAAGDVAVRIFPASTGGSATYDSGAEFDGAIAQGIFDVILGHAAPLLLDAEAQYHLELDVAGVEVIGDAAGGRWPFYPGGGSRARPDLEARIAALEAVVQPAPAAPHAVAARDLPVIAAGTYADQHALLAPAFVAGSAAAASARSNLLVQPVGVFTAGGVRAELGPYYLFTPGPNPLVRTIRDVPGDQGRSVRVRWRKDLRERPYVASDPQPRIMSYTLYRRVEPGQSAAAVKKPGLEELAALPPGDWDVLTSVPATLDSAYQTVVPTLCDSNDVGLCYARFVVRAITDQPGTFQDSEVDSGYSVDNIAPGVPQGLTAQAGAGGTQLFWLASTAPDFQYFRVYRNADPEFVPDPGNLVHSTATTQWTDPSPGSFTYKLTAVDANGNESPPASASVTTSVAGGIPSSIALAGAAPNPFRGSMSCVIDVPEACGRVDLAMFDLAGRRIRTLASGTLAAGRHTLTWNGRMDDGAPAPPGVYLVRLVGAGRTMTRRATLLP